MDININGRKYAADDLSEITLGHFIRSHGLTGTKLGCEEGVCGSCTVLLDGVAVRSCLMLAQQAEGHTVLTIEADNHILRVVQEEFDEYNALQCGYCTPGFIMSLVGLYNAEPHASSGRIKAALAGNLCRCTGYSPILEAARAAQQQLFGSCE